MTFLIPFCNYILYCIVNDFMTIPIFVIPEYKISRIKLVLWYTIIVGTIGTDKLFFSVYTSLEMVSVLINNIVFFSYFLTLLEKNKWKFWISYLFFMIGGMVPEIISNLIGTSRYFNEGIHCPRYFISCFVMISTTLFIYIIIFQILSFTGLMHTTTIDGKIIVLILSFSSFLIMSDTYIWNSYYAGESSRSFLECIIYILMPFVTLMFLVVFLVKTVNDNKKRDLEELQEAYYRQERIFEEIGHKNMHKAKLRHDYINNISIVKSLSKRSPEKAVELLEQMETQLSSYEE